MVTQVKIPLDDVLHYEDMGERVRQEASEDLGCSLGNGEGEYPWQIEDFWRGEPEGSVSTIVFEVGVEDRPN
jgi:hypothetical protein